jgi:hypothetical protein
MSTDEALGELGNLSRIGCGLAGGSLVVLNKVVSQGASGLKVLFKNLSQDTDAVFQIYGYASVAIATVLLCAGVAWFVPEKSRLKLAAIAVSAPALVSAWGSVPGKMDLAFITPAFAQSSTASPAVSSFWKGVELFFSGVPQDAPKYRVVVASVPTPTEAAEIASQWAQVAPTLHIAVADRAPGNPYFAVVASDFLPYASASEILTQVKKAPLGGDAYLSAANPNSLRMIPSPK